ncbi:MAG: hypothetical protein NC221_06785 [Duncaniella sp.]|nr:hypothetical protein [Muribaculum sp.]MCM1255806.1 hypothetical protein [Duncaniella sp.]
MATDYISLLNLTYEIEGLLMLHINRGEEASPEMTKLLEGKIRRLASYLPSQADIPVPVHTPTPDQEALVEAVIEEETEDAFQENPDLDQKAIAKAAIEEEIGDAYRKPVNPQMSTMKAEVSGPSAPKAEVTIPSVLVDKRIEKDEPKQDAEETLRLEDKLARDRARDIFKAFTINDKFRFRRELFRNSQDEFDETLYVIAQMGDFDEAEEYFYNDLCWDPGNEDVKEFMEIVKKHF